MSDTALFFVPVLIWGSTWLAITLQLGVVAPEVSVTYRFALASLLLAVGCVATGRSLRFKLRDHGFLAGVGLLMICVNYILIYRAERFVASGLVAVVYSTIVFMTPIGMRASRSGHRCGRASLSPRRWRWPASRSCSCRSSSSPREAEENWRWVSRSCSLPYAACAAGNLIAVRNHNAGIPTITGTVWTLAYGTLLL